MKRNNTEEPCLRFMVFVFSDYYPSGGLRDLEASFDTLEEVTEFLETEKFYNNVEIFDRIEGVEVSR